VTVFDAFNGVLFNTSIQPSAHIDNFVGTNQVWAPTGAYSTINTVTGAAVYSLPGGNWSIFGFPFTSPLPLNGIGFQDVEIQSNQDIYVTDYWVRRTLLSLVANTQRVGVLTWQSFSSFYSGLYFSPAVPPINLDLYVNKWDPTFPATKPCGPLQASCCTMSAWTPSCGQTQMPYDTTDSNGVELAYWADVEKVTATGPDSNYLIYAKLNNTPANEYLKYSHAQFTMFSRVSARNYEITFRLVPTADQLANNLFVPSYWVIACMYRGALGAVTYLAVLNTTTNASSELISTVPNASTYC